LTKTAKPYTPIPYTASSAIFLVADCANVLRIVKMKMKHVRPGLEKRALVVRLRRIKGQIEGIEKMVETDTDSSDVLMQVVSARRALKSFSEEVIESQLRAYVESAGNKPEGRQNLQSLLTVLERYVG
jgi:CsoR family transcriptional regulator, copper-sensing transcriptional repressor